MRRLHLAGRALPLPRKEQADASEGVEDVEKSQAEQVKNADPEKQNGHGGKQSGHGHHLGRVYAKAEGCIRMAGRSEGEQGAKPGNSSRRVSASHMLAGKRNAERRGL